MIAIDINSSCTVRPGETDTFNSYELCSVNHQDEVYFSYKKMNKKAK